MLGAVAVHVSHVEPPAYQPVMTYFFELPRGTCVRERFVLTVRCCSATGAIWLRVTAAMAYRLGAATLAHGCHV